jgi:phosphatidylinositol glycan class N
MHIQTVIFSLTWVRVELKQATSLFFKPFGPLIGYKATLVHITNLIAVGQFVLALQSAQDLISLALDGLHYFQTYDWLFLMSTITVGYLGWMLYILLHVLQSYTTFPIFHRKRSQRRSYNSQPGKAAVRLAGGVLMGISSLLLIVEQSPPLYHLYLGLAVFFWTEILTDISLLQSIGLAIRSAKLSWLSKAIFACLISFLVLELLVSVL